jgi:hypothetical protein
MMLKQVVLTAAAIGLAAVLASCQPDRFDESYDYETVATVFNESTDFGSFQTYALADSLGIIEIGEDTDVTHAYDSTFFSRVRANMNARGYTEIADPRAADLVIVTGVMTSDYVTGGCYYWWDYYCWYYCYPGGGWCYPYYTGTYTVGTVVTLMIDRASYDAALNTASLAWIGSIGSILSTNAAEISQKVDDMFAQSPYISAN